MCGINGIIHFKSNLPIMEDMIEQMNHSLSHRGPDASGKFHSSLVTLGHQRLSIIDISNHSNQPLFSTSKNTVVVFNGEIYNYIEI
ncbi:MAG: asparagine synthetase B, partial [Bacteroidota bacterium]